MVALSEQFHHNPTGYSQIVEEIVNGAVTRRYALGHWIISETQNISGAWTTSFYGYDGHNSVRFLTNAAGTVTDNDTFDAFGIKIAGSGTTPNQILYSGEYLDPGTGNYALRNRIYRQNTGTFLTADTTPGQLPYVYTSDNPVMFADPSGHDFTVAGVTASIGISLVISGGISGAVTYGATGGNVVKGLYLGTLLGTSLAISLDESPAFLTKTATYALIGGFLNATAKLAIDEISQAKYGGYDQFLQDFIEGAAYSAANSTFGDLYGRTAFTSATSAVVSSVVQDITDRPAAEPAGRFVTTVLLDAVIQGSITYAASALTPDEAGALTQLLKPGTGPGYIILRTVTTEFVESIFAPATGSLLTEGVNQIFSVLGLTGG